MSLTLADAQTPLPLLLHGESYFIQEMAEMRVIQERAQLAHFAMFAHEASSLRAFMLAQYFKAAVARWHDETGHSSLLSEKRNHPAYKQILELGEEAIPLILREIESRLSFIIMALHDITGENPIAVEHSGRLQLMTADWLKWGTERGYRQ